MGISLFIFRRDIRLEDNTGLAAAMKTSHKVLPCFIFDPQQLQENKYRSDAAVQFMLESLQDLGRQLREKDGRLYLFHGDPAAVAERLIKEAHISGVYVNRDYSPYSRKRDSLIREACARFGIQFREFGDCLLNEPEAVLKADGRPYTVFTPFYRAASAHRARKPQENAYGNYFTEKTSFEEDDGIYGRILPDENPGIRVHGGRNEAKKLLSGLGKHASYGRDRDYPAEDATTHLSAHLKFGTCSIREAYYAIGGRLGFDNPLIRQLYWRDFFTHIGYHFPQVFGRPFKEKYDTVPWSYDERLFTRWCEGETGFPIVDAGMRELNETGYMHNRVRMITASFLTKDLHIDWRKGEEYFAQKLVDYDPAVNNGNWQWAASTGCDAQPYFRVFNPWLQQKKYDPECRYVKKWIPELVDLKPEEIHDLPRKRPPKLAYPKPMVDHETEGRRTKAMFAAAR